MTSTNGEGNLSRTVLYEWHKAHGAKIVSFGGFEMPVQYQSGIISEHLAVRKYVGFFDISHMGRFLFSGDDAVRFLQFVLTNNVYALNEIGMAQYTLIQGENGGAVDDTYLYRIGMQDFMLVVNASNRAKDWEHLSQFFPRFPKLNYENISEEVAMMSLQGPNSEPLLEEILSEKQNSGRLPDNQKNRLSIVKFNGNTSKISRTGYTGEPVGFEIFVPVTYALAFWEHLLKTGKKYAIMPVGLGARDTLRFEAGYPLYGHELGKDPEENSIPIFALHLGRLSTRFDTGKGDYFAKEILYKQYLEVREVLRQNGLSTIPLEERVVSRLIWPLAVLNVNRDGPDRNPVRQGMEIYKEGKKVGWVTSGTVVPYWEFEGSGILSRIGNKNDKRAIGLAYIDSDVFPGDFGVAVEVKKGNGFVPALIVNENLRAAPPYARPVIHPE